MRIATYNINSIRIRIPALKALVKAENPDIICLQEIKVADELFPIEEVKKLGYPYVYISGQKGYHGVAVLSKIPLKDQTHFDFVGKGHKRHMALTLPDGTELHNFYIPAGGDIPDPDVNDKFDHKLRYYDEAIEWSASHRKKKKRMIMVGDMNVAPLEHDVWSHKQLLKIVSHTPPETERMTKLLQTLDWIDTSRHFVPHTEKLYSWWSYRNQDWEASNRGRRLDHIWITPELLPGLKASRILRDARNWENPSDHVPVVMDIEL